MVAGGGVGYDGDLPAVEDAVADAFVLAESVVGLLPSAGDSQGSRTVGQQCRPQPKAQLDVRQEGW
jgi:hypothetical protein